jgi:hypothetical protein
MERLEELVHLSIGRASMCWSETPTGVFNRVYAQKIAAELIQAIKESEQKALAYERAAWNLHPSIIRDRKQHEAVSDISTK